MNNREYYNRQNDDWTNTEVFDIQNEYLVKELNISQIADIHRRTPGSISFKLVKLGIIDSRFKARGYVEYKNSELYKDIVENGRISKNKTVKKLDIVKGKVEEIVKTKSDQLIEIKNEIDTLKKDVKEILRLMNALYEFENNNES